MQCYFSPDDITTVMKTIQARIYQEENDTRSLFLYTNTNACQEYHHTRAMLASAFSKRWCLLAIFYTGYKCSCASSVYSFELPGM